MIIKDKSPEKREQKLAMNWWIDELMNWRIDELMIYQPNDEYKKRIK